MRRSVYLVPIAVVASIGGCGSSSSSGNTPAQFASKAGAVCVKVAPRLKTTSTAITALDAAAGNPLDKLPKLAGLLGQLDGEFADLHHGLGAIGAPAAQKAPYARFLGDLGRLEQLTRQGTTFLAPGTISGLRQFKALGTQLNAATTALGSDASKVPGLSACNNLS
ncbi:MAG: hypothetical protein ACR2ND_15925 [Solirubrobacteraceae bacterium]